MRRALIPVGWFVFVALTAGWVSLTGWAVLGLLGLLPAPTPGGHPMTPADLASMAVAGAALILATATVLLAVYTRRNLEQGREELKVTQDTLKAAEQQAITSGEQVAATLEPVRVRQGQASTARDA